MISLIFIILASVCKSIMDVLYFRWNKSIFSKDKYKKYHDWLNPSESWDNKWKDGEYTKGEKFLGSSTIFVFITDMWHFMQTLMLFMFFISIIVYNPLIHPIVDILIFYVVYGVVFELFYSKILIKK